MTARSLEQLIAFNNSHPRELVLFDQSIFEAANAMGGLEDEAYVTARATADRVTREEGIDKYLADHDVDLLVAPSGIPAPRVDPINGDVWPPFIGVSWLAAVAGYPHATVPMGTVSSLPVGLSFIGARDEDAAILAVAYAYEQASLARVDPQYYECAEDLAHIAAGMAAP